MLGIINPATEQKIREVEEDTPGTIADKLQRARVAQPAWGQVPVETRVVALRRFKEALAARRDELATTLTQEMGKPIAQARNEVNATGDRIQFFLDNVAQVLKPEPVQKGDTSEHITYEPLGVIANVSAWNYPYFVGTNVFVPALLTGNAVLYKPSEFATLTGLHIAEMLHNAGVPKDIFAPVVGGGSIGAQLLEHPLDGAFFTGSYATGAKIAAAAAKHLMKVQLELGGKDPIYVCEDVDVAKAASGIADGAFYNTGQSCCSVERIYVHEKIYNAFVDAFMNTVRSFVVGDPTDDKTYIGPLTRAPQLNVLSAQVQDAVAKGAKVLCGGKRMGRAGYYFEPTVLANVDHTMAVMRDESFGPIIGIQSVPNDITALQVMNDTEYGLTAGVYTRDEARATKLLQSVHAGSVYWNCCDRVSPRLPWTGRKHSGIGSTLSLAGIRTFVQPKGWHWRMP